MSTAAQSIPEGYKQTEIGVIPSDWDMKPLSEITDPLRPISYGIVQTGPNMPNGVRCLRVLDIESGRVNKGELISTARSISDSYKRTILKCGDLVTPLRGKVGEVASIDEELAGANLTRGVALIAVLPELHPHFVKQVISSPLGRSRLEQSMNGSALQEIPIATLRAFKIPLPPTLTEQEAVAAALSDADGLIESLDALIAKKRQIKHGTMQELLTGQKRLPGFSGKWKKKCFHEVAHPRSERVDPRRSGPFDFCIELEHIEQGTGRLLGSTATTETSSLKSVFKPRDVLFGKLRAYLRKYWIADRGGVCSTEIWVLTPREEQITSEYLFQVVTVDRFIEAASTAYGTHMPRSDWNVVKNFEIHLPKPNEQTAIASILSDMDAEIEDLESKLAKVRQVKQGMLQELLTGRIRLLQPTATTQQPSTAAKVSSSKKAGHNRQIEEAVVIGVLAKTFGNPEYPLANVRRVKLTYLLERYSRGNAEGYLKKAAGPYKPATKYKGAVGIAIKNAYVRECNNGSYTGFAAGENIAQAEAYFQQWYQPDALDWLKQQFRFEKTDTLELLATVDMAMEDLRRDGKPVSLSSVKAVIRDNPEWKAKLERNIFSDTKITEAITRCDELFADTAG